MKAPGTLSKDAAKLYEEVCGLYDLDRAQQVMLQTAMEQYGLYLQFLAEVQREGASTEARDGIKAHPAVSAMKTARDGFLAAWKTLGIGIEVRDVGRPTDERELKWASRLGVVKGS